MQQHRNQNAILDMRISDADICRGLGVPDEEFVRMTFKPKANNKRKFIYNDDYSMKWFRAWRPGANQWWEAQGRCFHTNNIYGVIQRNMDMQGSQILRLLSTSTLYVLF